MHLNEFLARLTAWPLFPAGLIEDAKSVSKLLTDEQRGRLAERLDVIHGECRHINKNREALVAAADRELEEIRRNTLPKLYQSLEDEDRQRELSRVTQQLAN